MPNWNIITLELTSASVSELLTVLNRNGIILRSIRYIDDLRVEVRVIGSDYFKIDQLVRKRGDALRTINNKGLYYIGITFLKRPILLFGLTTWLFLVLIIPTRVLFVHVDGNRAVDSESIIEAAEKCGIHFGASRRYVRSEKVKNQLLEEIDALQWVGVNTYGCVAVISVKERAVTLRDTSEHRINSIVASRDGIISEITVTKGNLVCKVGQAVREGQLLVSAYTDCGLSVKAESAEAEITALTNHQISAVTLSSANARTHLKEIKKRYGIQIGKNVVKLYIDSGISDTGCVKIYSRKQLTLPGGFELPVSLLEETLYFYDCETDTFTNDEDFAWMQHSVDSYLKNTMVAGRILYSTASSELQDGICCYNGIYTCEEIIGQVRIEKIGDADGKRNR